MDRLSDDVRPAASPVLADSEDERAIGENLCQPPPSRAPVELPLLAVSRAVPVDRSFDDRSLEELLLNDLPVPALAAAARVEKKC
jgi:hypothetical protein